MMASRTSGQKTRLPPLCRALRIILLHLKRLATLRQMEMYFSTVWVVMHEAPIFLRPMLIVDVHSPEA